ncbi:Glyoxalase/bleomycin resistance [Comamonas thiooxydans]|nr:Glyoxalase/bleomycin resistance [Comamonas thiooxydans]
MPSLPIATMLSGLNHLTLAVADLPLSLDFYVRVLGFRPRAQWDTGAYLGLGNLWLCLSSDEQRRQARSADYTHYAFTLAQQDFAHFVEHARSCGVREWKSNHSEGDSFYFLDPDGHQLEAHVGSLEAAWRNAACGLMRACGFSTEPTSRQRRQYSGQNRCKSLFDTAAPSSAASQYRGARLASPH